MCQENQLLYPLDSGLLGGQCYPPFDQLGPDGIFMKGKVCIFRRIGFKFFLFELISCDVNKRKRSATTIIIYPCQ